MARSHRPPPVVMATPPAATGAAEGQAATSFAGRESAAAPRGARLAANSNRAAVTGDVPRAGVAERRVAASGLRCVSPLATGGCGLVPARCVRARDRYRRTTCLSRTTGKNTAFEAPETDCLGTPIVYSPVKADLTGNIKKIRAVYDSNPSKFKTLQNILEAEKEMHGSAWPKTGATLALMWLKRGLKFMLVLLQSISDGERDEEHPNLIRVNAMKAYEIALKKYHGWMLQKLFMGSVYALPYKSDLLKALEKGKEVKEEESIEKIHQFLSKATPILDAIYEMYTKMNAELTYKA